MAAADTVVAIATAPGRGGIGVIRVSGPAVVEIMRAITGIALSPRSASFVSFRDGAGESIDQGIALYFPAPRSYTGEDILELHGHGGPAVLRLLVRRCLDLGARLAEPGEFTRRAFLNDKLDLAQAEAVADLIDASTEQAARGAARSLQGAFSALVRELQGQLTDLRALIEVTLDFPEEEPDVLHREGVLGRLGLLQAKVDSTLHATRQGSLLREGVRIALIGPPNCGKSTIINMLSGDDVAIVSPVPGTTRDLVRQTVELRGIPVHLIDTAGLRATDDPVEEIGIARTWKAVTEVDLAIIVLDGTGMTRDAASEVAHRLPEKLPRIYLHNKIDLTAGAPRIAWIAGNEHVWISAKFGSGLEQLVDSILRICGAASHGEGGFIARERHIRALQVCAARLVSATAHLSQLELAAEELRLAQSALSQLTGEYVADDLLGEIFSRFCIGK